MTVQLASDLIGTVTKLASGIKSVGKTVNRVENNHDAHVLMLPA